MVPSFRYHLLTLVAVFLALGLGMVIGIAYLQGPTVDSLTRQVRELNLRFTTEVAPLREENRSMAEGIAALRRQVTQAVGLSGKAAVVRTGDYPEAARAVREVLTEAGLTVQNTTVVPHEFPVKARLAMDRIVARLSATRPQLQPRTDQVIKIVAENVARGGASTELETLRDLGLVETDGSYAQSVDYVVIVGGAGADYENRSATVDLPLIDALKSLGVRVAYVEPRDVGQSSLRAVADRDIAVIRSVDTDLGRIGLVLALREDQGARGRSPNRAQFAPVSARLR